MRNNLIKLVLLTLLSLAGLSQHPAHVKKIELYVSPSGRDTNTGTEKKPFKTIGRALVAVRELKKKKQITADGIDIIFREGTYFLNEPLSFTSENSGSPNAPITYRAYEKEKVVLSGGRRISGWKRVEGNLWKTHLPEVQAGKWNFRQLFANDNRITRARTPNADAPEQKKILFSNALSILKAKPSKTIA